MPEEHSDGHAVILAVDLERRQRGAQRGLGVGRDLVGQVHRLAGGDDVGELAAAAGHEQVGGVARVEGGLELAVHLFVLHGLDLDGDARIRRFEGGGGVFPVLLAVAGGGVVPERQGDAAVGVLAAAAACGAPAESEGAGHGEGRSGEDLARVHVIPVSLRRGAPWDASVFGCSAVHALLGVCCPRGVSSVARGRRRRQTFSKMISTLGSDAMTRRPTIHDVAAAAGVSVATVSKAVNGRYGVSPETVSRVLDAVKTLGYESSLVASSMRSRRTGVIGVLVADIEPFSAEILKGVGGALSDTGTTCSRTPVPVATAKGGSVARSAA